MSYYEGFKKKRRNRTVTSRKEKIYLFGIMATAIMMLGTAGSMEIGTVTMQEGVWQICCSLALGLWMCNGIRLEETRAARRVVR
jgi:O-antigen ligase